MSLQNLVDDLRLKVKQKLVDYDLSEWSIRDQLSGESYPCAEGEWGDLRPIIPIQSAPQVRGMLFSPCHFDYVFSRYQNGREVERRLLTQEQYQQIQIALREGCSPKELTTILSQSQRSEAPHSADR